MDSYNASQVLSGTFGDMWLNGDMMAETTALQAKVALTKATIPMCGSLVDGVKVTGITLKGTVVLNKVTSKFITLLSADIKAGKTPEFTIISLLADPDGLGAERISLTGVIFDELTLIDWTAKKEGVETMPFTFQDWNPIDLI